MGGFLEGLGSGFREYLQVLGSLRNRANPPPHTPPPPPKKKGGTLNSTHVGVENRGNFLKVPRIRMIVFWLLLGDGEFFRSLGGVARCPGVVSTATP